jgi:hypothetical protein
MGFEEGEDVQAKGILNIFNKIITENFPKLKKVLPRKPPGHQTDLAKIKPPHNLLSLNNKHRYRERILKAIREGKE